jgi:HD-like signal output (HDOD) protein
MTASANYLAIIASDHLPSPGPIAFELLELSRRQSIDLCEVERVVASDPAISARALRAVNSAAFGSGIRVVSVAQAVRLLGLRGLARIAVEVTVLGKHRQGLAEFDYSSFWAESLARGAAAHVLANATGSAERDEAFTCGLLGTIGRLALVSTHPATYREMLATLGSADSLALAEAEREVFDVDVELLSALMMRSWGMPAYHDAMVGERARDPATIEHDERLLLICRAAGHVARLLVAHRTSRGELAKAMQALAMIGIDAAAAAQTFPDIVSEYHDCGRSFKIPVSHVGSLAEIYAAASDEPRPPRDATP